MKPLEIIYKTFGDLRPGGIVYTEIDQEATLQAFADRLNELSERRGGTTLTHTLKPDPEATMLFDGKNLRNINTPKRFKADIEQYSPLGTSKGKYKIVIKNTYDSEAEAQTALDYLLNL